MLVMLKNIIITHQPNNIENPSIIDLKLATIETIQMKKGYKKNTQKRNNLTPIKIMQILILLEF